MDKVYHAFAYFIAFMMPFLLSSQCGAEATEDEAKAMVERSNQRCDDFYRYRRQLEETDKKREKDAGEIKKVRSDHEKTLELAREEYVMNRKKTIVDPKLEKQHDEAEQAWKEQNKMAGKRYAERKAAAEAIEKKGCRVPEMKEYDLED